jgi:hypothetical protein
LVLHQRTSEHQLEFVIDERRRSIQEAEDAVGMQRCADGFAGDCHGLSGASTPWY